METKNLPKFINLKDSWFWGDSVTIVATNGLALVEVDFDNKYPSVAFIRGLIVHHSNRKQGWGTYMLSLCETTAKLHCKTFVQLNVDKRKEWLVNWYKRNGYAIIYEDDNEYTMWKDITK